MVELNLTSVHIQVSLFPSTPGLPNEPLPPLCPYRIENCLMNESETSLLNTCIITPFEPD